MLLSSRSLSASSSASLQSSGAAGDDDDPLISAQPLNLPATLASVAAGDVR